MIKIYTHEVITESFRALFLHDNNLLTKRVAHTEA